MNMQVGERLLDWYDNNKRDLPWRKTNDPYKIWVSEIVFQQTRIDQGLNYYLRFVERFPNLQSLAQASEDEVLNMWQGLGYYSRARNLHNSAQRILDEFNGVFPENYKDILSLKGVGPYTAAAIASIAFNLPYPVIDGNVNRLISRLYGIKDAVDTKAGQKKIEQKITSIFISKRAGDFNQAMMEFGALQCKPANPLCENCVLQETCYAYKNDAQSDFPVKKNSIAPKPMFLYFLVMELKEGGNNYYLLNKRTNHSIWKNMFEFPSIESKGELSVQKLKQLASEEWGIEISAKDKIEFNGPFNHKLTHRNISAYFIDFPLKNQTIFLDEKKFLKISAQNLKNYAVPKLVENYIKKHIFTSDS